jgi:hypothetical protein
MLAPCTSCRRHVRADEPCCPFCGGAIGEATNRAVARAPRVAMLFAGALGIAGCSATDDGNVVAMYGAPISDSATLDTSMGALYGGPPVDSAVKDSASPPDTATAPDTSVADGAKDSGAADVEEDTWSPVPPYGAPLLDSGEPD